MSLAVRQQIHQTKPFSTLQEEVFVGLSLVAQMIEQPWNRFLLARAQINTTQYNILRILRGAGGAGLSMGELTVRMISRDRDVVPLVEQLVARGLVVDLETGPHHRLDLLGITADGLDLLGRLDGAVVAMPRKVLGHLHGDELSELDRLLGRVIEGDLHFP